MDDHRNDPNEFTDLANLQHDSDIKDELAKWLPDFDRLPPALV